MKEMNPKVDEFFRNAKKWQAEMAKFREIMLGCELSEELKWGKPCYVFQNKNIVIIQGFKEYCALLFFKGALLKDMQGILVKIGENTQAGRQIRVTRVREIVERESIIKDYIAEAIEVEKAGLQVIIEQNPKPVPEELQRKLDEIPALKSAFSALTPGRQRAYVYYFSAPKQSKTRASRVEKCLPQILDHLPTLLLRLLNFLLLTFLLLPRKRTSRQVFPRFSQVPESPHTFRPQDTRHPPPAPYIGAGNRSRARHRDSNPGTYSET